MINQTNWVVVACAFLLCAPFACAQDTTISESNMPPWRVRLTGEMGGAHFEYAEDLSSLGAKSRFESGSFGIQLGVEGNLSGFSPYLRLADYLSSGKEKTKFGTTRQEVDLIVEAFVLDVGAGYRFQISEPVTLVPSLGYTLDLTDFERSDFEIDGQPAVVMDLNNVPKLEVEETFEAHGVSLGLGLEVELSSRIALHTFAAYTHLAEVEVDNEIGGALDTDGYMVRGGAAVNVRLLWGLSIRGTVQVGSRELDKSSPKLRGGAGGLSLVQFPESSTLWVFVGVGVQASF
jgi:hypothetical protein